MPDHVQFGVLLPTRDLYATPKPRDVDHVLRFAVRAEQLGYASVWAGDSLRLPRLEPLVTLGAVAAVTRTVAIGTAAIVPALRETLMAAQAVTSLDALCHGRLILTLGAGFPEASKVQFEGTGASYATRYTRLDDIVTFWRALWSNPGLERFDGAQLHFEALPKLPQPARPGGPPLWFAGATPRGLQRTGAVFDGWMPYPPNVADYAAGLAGVRAAAEAAGRSASAITPSLYATVLVEQDPARAREALEEFCRGFYELPLEYIGSLQLLIAGSAAQVREQTQAYVEAGARHLVLRIAALGESEQLELVADALGVHALAPGQEEELAQRYVALWNDPDPARRRETLRSLWAADGVQLLQPPEP
jgi:alkanesulfonate monooxygenase SsuD/methylene tetrahydromethanopterin reductase-like flavin-dependent oxidoreductase (luciferase family)